MIAELAAVIFFAVGGQDLIHADVSGSRRWRVAAEGPGGVVAFVPTAADGDTREVVLMITARLVETPGEQAVVVQRFFVHMLDCKAWTQAETEFGLTDPPPRRWTPMDGPPISRRIAAPKPIEPNTAMVAIAEAVCREADATLPEVEGEWSAVSRALRQRVEASSMPDPSASDQ